MSKTRPPQAQNGGRPFLLKADEPTLKTLQNLGQIHATWDEAALVLNVTKPTFWAFMEREPRAKEAFERGKAEGKLRLRRSQMQSADKGSVAAQIWLGKQWLEQQENVRISGTGPGGSIPILDVNKLADLSDQELEVLEKVFGRLALAEGADPETLELTANKEEDES